MAPHDWKSTVHRHWMLIPTSIAIPIIVVMLILASSYHWSAGAQGSAFLGILAITAAVGSLLAPPE
jgi:hypothetical protein